VKELWIETPETTPPEMKKNILNLAAEANAVVLEGERAVRQQDKQEILLLDRLDKKRMNILQREHKQVALRIDIAGKEDENKAVEAAEQGVDYIIIDCRDWRIIPLENLIARTRGKSKLIARVNSTEDARLVLETLELGTDGVLLETNSAEEMVKTVALVKKQDTKVKLIKAKISTIKQIGTGARVCVDTCDLMSAGEGILVGVQSAGLFLVEAEVGENPYVQSRPFRVNAGSLPLYTLASLENTRYLSELKSGDEVLIVDRNGNVRITNVGRAKIEFRPLILIEAETDGKKLKAILQNAETIRLVTPTGSKPVTELQAGDEVLVHLAAAGGRHFGVSVPEETVIER
jgi:3-dehydroquinate synthase II